MIDMMEQKTILIVDDENMMREAVASYLEKQGYHVLQAETGTQALSLLEKETVSFVILDLMLPDISGEENLFQNTQAVPDSHYHAHSQNHGR